MNEALTAAPKTLALSGKIALVGHPNVGKSALFHQLTGQRVIISNYPGTTVELSRAEMRQLRGITLVDTPGVVVFPPYSEDEVVTERVLLEEPLLAILQVGDAKNLRRTLLLTLQLAEMGLPLVLALNMLDEAYRLGVQLDQERIAHYFGAPVVLTAAIHGLGVDRVITALQEAQPTSFSLTYPADIEQALERFIEEAAPQIGTQTQISLRALGLLWLSGDRLLWDWLRQRLDADTFSRLEEMRLRLDSPAWRIQQRRLEAVDDLVSQALLEEGERRGSWAERLAAWTTHPLLGWFILAMVLYGMYWFVGVFGAGTLVGLLEESLFGEIINPTVTAWVERLSPWEVLTAFLVGPYGVWTMGMTYAVALILPIVTTFFLAFGLLEDSGYLPRLAALSNRIFKALGLNGKAVLPMVLGLGCVTMATLTTRVLESKRERLLATLLLALAVPCSAQLGVVMGMLASVSFTALLIWAAVVVLVMLIVGWLAARLVPGERALLLVELPPLRWPQPSNVLIKTLARLEWYGREVVPLFLVGAVIMFALDRTHLLEGLIRLGEPLVHRWLGLPAEASAAFVMGFLRRDFGATGLFVMESQGLLSPLQVLVAMVTITLFVPCIASVMMIGKEHGWPTAMSILALVTPLALLVGGLLNHLLLALGWGS